MPAFSLLTWNVENLFAPSLAAEAERRDLFSAKIRLIAQVIAGQSPDVIALQEVGGEEAVAALRAALPDEYDRQFLSAFPDGRGIRTAFITRLPLQARTDLVDLPAGPAYDLGEIEPDGAVSRVRRMGRGALHIRVDAGGVSVDCVTVHFKSKLLSFSRPGGGSSFVPRDEDERVRVACQALRRRAAEAAAVRRAVNELLEAAPGRAVIVAGDLNDVPEAQTSLLLQGPPGSEIGTRGFNRPDKGDAQRLFNLAGVIPSERRYSRVFRGRGELLDQILVSEGLLLRDADGDRQLPAVDALVDFAETLPSIGEDPGERDDSIIPDHAPVVAQFNL